MPNDLQRLPNNGVAAALDTFMDIVIGGALIVATSAAVISGLVLLNTAIYFIPCIPIVVLASWLGIFTVSSYLGGAFKLAFILGVFSLFSDSK